MFNFCAEDFESDQDTNPQALAEGTAAKVSNKELVQKTKQKDHVISGRALNGF